MNRQQPKRASGMKALQAIKENSVAGRVKVKDKKQPLETLKPSGVGVKRVCSSPHSKSGPKAKRNPLSNVTNVVNTNAIAPNKSQLTKQQTTRRSQRIKQSKTSPPKAVSNNCSVESDNELKSSQNSNDTPVTEMQHCLQAASLSDDSLRSDEVIDESIEVEEMAPKENWHNIDEAEAHDHLFSSEYAPDIFHYMRRRESEFEIPRYLDWQLDVTENMRSILIDWLIEVQENFEFFHETLYLGVKIVDRYLVKKEVKKEYLQLVGATAMLIAAKFEELSPPLVDDFLYLCDDAYKRKELIQMETEILHALDYDLNVPIAYRFLRRLARAASATMETHTLARYISECTLQEYKFVDTKPSLIAASSMYLALRMKKIGSWTSTLQYYSGYSLREILPCVKSLNELVQAKPSTVCTVRNKYSHQVFFSVALIPALSDVQSDADSVH